MFRLAEAADHPRTSPRIAGFVFPFDPRPPFTPDGMIVILAIAEPF
jgi:hypothetical protein